MGRRVRSFRLSAASGQGVPQDYAKAREWYDTAAAAGDAGAIANIGGLYAKGQGVPQDYAKAREWYENAAAAGAHGQLQIFRAGTGVSR